MILFTCDIDWSPDPIIAHTLDLFEKYQIKCSLFATHKSNTIIKSNKNLFEIAIHPNFNPLLEGKITKEKNIHQVFTNLMNIYPQAKGYRSHMRAQSTQIIYEACKQHLIYDASVMLPYSDTIKPIKLWNNVIMIPYNWEDDIHFLYKKSFKESNLNLKSALNVVNFHPIHVYLNTENEQRYQDAKKYYQNPTRLKRYINKSKITGTKDLLVNLLEFVKSNKSESITMCEIALNYFNND